MDVPAKWLGKPSRFFAAKWDEGLFKMSPLAAGYRDVKGSEEEEKEEVEKGVVDEVAGGHPIDHTSRSAWPTVLQTLTYLAAALLIGTLGYHLGTTYEHEHNIASYYSTLNNGAPIPSDHSIHTVDNAVHTTAAEESSHQRLAFATFLAQYVPPKGTDPEEDMYFIQTRILTYQFLHDPLTRTEPDIPFLVLVTPEVEEWKKEQLRRDGATVILIEKVKFEYHFEPRWKDVMSKLQMFNLEDYDKICFLDADTTLVAPLTDVFSDPGSRIRTTGANAAQNKSDETPLPPTYLMAAKSESSGHISKHIPPPPASITSARLDRRTQNSSSPDYFNAGFFVFKPSKLLFEYYLSVLPHYDRYNVLFPEQNLWNYAHRREGNMPWTSVRWDWNVFGAKDADLEYGVKSMHARIWAYGDSERKEFWAGKKAMMETFFAWREEVKEEEERHFKDPLKATWEDVKAHDH